MNRLPECWQEKDLQDKSFVAVNDTFGESATPAELMKKYKIDSRSCKRSSEENFSIIKFLLKLRKHPYLDAFFIVYVIYLKIMSNIFVIP